MRSVGKGATPRNPGEDGEPFKVRQSGHDYKFRNLEFRQFIFLIRSAVHKISWGGWRLQNGTAHTRDQKVSSDIGAPSLIRRTGLVHTIRGASISWGYRGAGDRSPA